VRTIYLLKIIKAFPKFGKLMKNQSVGNRIDYISILLYIVLVITGWMTIYSASLPLEETSIFDISQIYHYDETVVSVNVFIRLL
jgi:cell division protein FtsW (lipid II flippase)